MADGVEPDAYQGQLLGALTPARNPASREQAVASVAERLAGELDTLRIVGGSGITLAAQRSTLPLTIENSATGTRRVVLHFASDKLVVDQDGLVVELPPGSTTIDLDVEARAIGDTPLTVRLQVPDDADRVLTQDRLRVRSTAVPGLGLLLSGAAAAFLVGWWIVSVGRRRDNGSDGPDPDREPVDAGVPSADLQATTSLSP